MSAFAEWYGLESGWNCFATGVNGADDTSTAPMAYRAVPRVMNPTPLGQLILLKSCNLARRDTNS